MQTLLGCMPLIAGLVIVVMAGNIWPGWGWRRAFVRGVVASAGYMVLVTEGLSLVHGIHQASLVVVWAMPALVGIGLWVKVRREGGHVAWPPVRLPGDRWVQVEGAMVGVVLLLTGVVAWLAPPQTWDSLTYHMARVAHWAQNGSLAHYATGIARQNLMSPGAEIGMLQEYVLGQSDRLVNFVQWTAMVVSVITAGFVAGELGAGRRGQAFAAVFVATLPMGISEATSTMTDYVAAVWMICLAYEAVGYMKGGGGMDGYVFMGLTSGLAALTKPTTFPYLLPFALVVLVVGLRKYGWRRFSQGAVVVGVVVVVLNLGYWGRNVETYGNPMGSSQRISKNGNAIFGPKVLISNLLRNASLQAGTPWSSLNAQFTHAIVAVHQGLGLDINDPRTSAHQGFGVRWPGRDELTSANQIQALLVLVLFVVFFGLGVSRAKRFPWMQFSYAVLGALGFVFFSAVFKYTPNGSRYQMPFFVLMAPAVAWLFDRFRRSWPSVALAAVMLVYAGPWLVGINTRPLLARAGGDSLLDQPRRDFYFAHAPGLKKTFLDLTKGIQEAGDRSVGVMLGGDAAEYPLFVFLGAPSTNIRLEWIISGAPSEVYRDPGFVPDAIICDSSCPEDWDTVSGLPLARRDGAYRLYSAK